MYKHAFIEVMGYLRLRWSGIRVNAPSKRVPLFTMHLFLG